jgi:hypothetical protein
MAKTAVAVPSKIKISVAEACAFDLPEQKSRVIQPDFTMGHVSSVVANYFTVTEVDITKESRVRKKRTKQERWLYIFARR